MTKGTPRKVYVLMYQAVCHSPTCTDANDRSPRELCICRPRDRAMFATATRKRDALRHARRLQATVYPVPYPGTGWDCPTIRACFDPIYTPAGGREGSQA